MVTYFSNDVKQLHTLDVLDEKVNAIFILETSNERHHEWEIDCFEYLLLLGQMFLKILFHNLLLGDTF